jgi:hypothetical protein
MRPENLKGRDHLSGRPKHRWQEVKETGCEVVNWIQVTVDKVLTMGFYEHCNGPLSFIKTYELFEQISRPVLRS